MLREVKATQRKVRVLGFKSTTDTLVEGAYDGTMVVNSTGNYTITFAKAFARAPIAVATTRTTLTSLRVVSVTATAINILGEGADQSTATTADFDLLVWGFDTADKT